MIKDNLKTAILEWYDAKCNLPYIAPKQDPAGLVASERVLNAEKELAWIAEVIKHDHLLATCEHSCVSMEGPKGVPWEQWNKEAKLICGVCKQEVESWGNDYYGGYKTKEAKDE